MLDVLEAISIVIIAAVTLACLVDYAYRRWVEDSEQGWLYLSPLSMAGRGTPASVGIDVYPIRDYLVDAGKTVMIETGLIIKPPRGHFAMLVERSSLHKQGLNLANNIGIIDPDYCGKEDTIKVAVRNFNGLATIVSEKQAVAQIIFVPYFIHGSADGLPPAIHVDAIPTKSRGGYGSTNRK